MYSIQRFTVCCCIIISLFSIWLWVWVFQLFEIQSFELKSFITSNIKYYHKWCSKPLMLCMSTIILLIYIVMCVPCTDTDTVTVCVSTCHCVTCVMLMMRRLTSFEGLPPTPPLVSNCWVISFYKSELLVLLLLVVLLVLVWMVKPAPRRYVIHNVLYTSMTGTEI